MNEYRNQAQSECMALHHSHDSVAALRPPFPHDHYDEEVLQVCGSSTSKRMVSTGFLSQCYMGIGWCSEAGATVCII